MACKIVFVNLVETSCQNGNMSGLLALGKRRTLGRENEGLFSAPTCTNFVPPSLLNACRAGSWSFKFLTEKTNLTVVSK